MSQALNGNISCCKFGLSTVYFPGDRVPKWPGVCEECQGKSSVNPSFLPYCLWSSLILLPFFPSLYPQVTTKTHISIPQLRKDNSNLLAMNGNTMLGWYFLYSFLSSASLPSNLFSSFLPFPPPSLPLYPAVFTFPLSFSSLLSSSHHRLLLAIVETFGRCAIIWI